MSTTVHLPSDLLESVDRRAGELGVSRNRYIIQALERALEEETGWSPGFLEHLAAAREDTDGRKALAEMRRTFASRRTRKSPPAL